MQTSSTDAPQPASQCLHLGRSGNRCSRSALDGGFCERHSPNAPPQFAFTASRKIAAILLAAAVLWPILLDLYRAFRR